MKDKEDTDENKEMCAKIANASAAGTLRHAATTASDLSIADYAVLRESVGCAVRTAATEIRESIYPDLQYKPTPASVDSKNKAKMDQASLYNSHARAAHSSTTAAYSSGSASDHEVAAAHHEIAAEHSGKAQDLHDAGSDTYKDYKAAKDYHAAQSKAHKAAAATANRGNSFTHYDYPYSRY